jgi:hypothetical protein
MAPLGLLLVQADAADCRGIAEQALVGIHVHDRTILIALVTDGLSAASFDEVFALDRLRASMTAKWIVVCVQDALERGGLQR